ncbi:outer membrane protein TolC [Lacibacter cauensis]|uniref:Outer membrane protein TolC n=1 Tax=Lacibacter cauensis TaxID=510947 RepID=A0A562SDH5_9BACT|nr:TolC family protein [Lacibacter cauensis]TWI79329.1 outer membrane protein TolC [Lacibacter cauensis]
MLKRLFTGIVAFSGIAIANAQQLRLEQMVDKAIEHYPATKQKEYVRALGKESEKMIHSNEFPQASVTGQATYQSEVTKFNFPGIVGPKPDNYNIGVDLRYPLTEFDVLRTRKEIEKEKTENGLHQLDIELQKVRERVTVIYGNILLQKENKKILQVRKSELETQRKKVASAVANGAVLKSNLLILESEILSTEQKLTDIDATVDGLTQELSLLTGTAVTAANEFLMPATETIQTAVNRPELKLFQSQLNLLGMQDKLLKKENRAKLFLFGQGFYGRPGYNFLNQSFRPYGIAGVGINWSINNAATQKIKQHSIAINKQIVAQQQATFELNLQTAMNQKQTEINKYQSIILKDREIVNKRKEILQVASSQLENGAITSTEYVTELNAENTAELNLLFHQVQQAIAKVQYNALAGY